MDFTNFEPYGSRYAIVCFIKTMNNNCKGEMDYLHSLNPLTHLSKWFITSQIVVQNISSLAKIVIMQVVLWKTNKLDFMKK